MTLKDLRDYLNGLDLNEVDSEVELVVHVHDNQNGASDFGVVDIMSDFQLIIPDKVGVKPYLSILGETLTDYLDSFHQENRVSRLRGN